ncbi:MAG: GH32 C-terminal domain-containing protein, partial [Roseiflexaceae bacterium]
DGRGFVNENPATDIRWTDYGEDYYAAVSWFNLAPGDARRVWIGWINNWRYAKNVPTAPWQGAMSIPRQVGLKRMGTDLRLTEQPIAELAALRGQGYCWNDLALAPGQNPLSELRGTSLEIIAEIECAAAQVVGFRLRQGVQMGVAVAYDMQAASIFVDRTGADVLAFDPNFPGKHAAPLDALGGRIMLHLFLDTCSVEVFGNDGNVVITDLIFPNPDDDRLELFAVGGTAIMRSLVVYRFGQIQRDVTAGAAGLTPHPPLL